MKSIVISHDEIITQMRQSAIKKYKRNSILLTNLTSIPNNPILRDYDWVYDNVEELFINERLC